MGPFSLKPKNNIPPVDVTPSHQELCIVFDPITTFAPHSRAGAQESFHCDNGH
jgi:hypothetical protein